MNFNKQALDRYITGNYGEDQFKDEQYNPAFDAQAVRAAGLAVDLPLSVRLYLDKSTGAYHYAEYAPGDRKPTHALCGKDLAQMRERPFFPVGDYRGLVVYMRGCDECRNQLRV